jgi:Flp pilus assembly protein TadG
MSESVPKVRSKLRVHSFTRTIRRFLGDTAGSYAPLFAVAALPVFGTVSAAVEYSNIFKVETHLKTALDAAALAAARELPYSTDDEYLQTYARKFFDSNLNPVLDPSDVEFDMQVIPPTTQGTRIEVSASHVYQTYMAGVIGIEEVPMRVAATIATGNRTVEIALVVDNSGSMDNESGPNGETRMELARLASTELVSTLHTVAQYSNKPDPIKIAVVPFAGSVNVGPQHRGADWLDMKGWSSIHHQNFDWTGADTAGDGWPSALKTGAGWKSATSTVSVGPNPPDPLPAGIVSYNTDWLSRWTLLDTLGVDWAGCVEMRPDPYSTTDTAATDVTPDTLFVPMFAPDEPDRRNSSEDNDYGNRYLSDYVRPGPDYAVTSANSGSFAKQAGRQDWTLKYNADARQRDGQNRILIGRTRSDDLGPWGPNMGCTTDPLTPLSANQATTQAAIDAMAPGGFTNVQEGLAWGWRTVSPAAPFTEGRGYETFENDKYVILLTDGNNTYPAQSTLNQTEYYAWGYGKDARVTGGLASWTSNVDAMNQQTARTCANMKAFNDADGEQAITIFTIVYDVADGSSVKDLLYECASTSKKGQKYYYDVQGAAIADAMKAIGNEISQLRIEK